MADDKIRFQHVVVTLADGRRGVFYGPELIKEVEMKLNVVPNIVDIVFEPGKEVDLQEKGVSNADSKSTESTNNLAKEA